METHHIKLLSEEDFNHLMGFEKTALLLLKNKFSLDIEEQDLADKIVKITEKVNQYTRSQPQMTSVTDSEIRQHIKDEAVSEYLDDIITDIKNASGGVWYKKKNGINGLIFYFLEDDDAAYFKLTYG